MKLYWLKNIRSLSIALLGVTVIVFIVSPQDRTLHNFLIKLKYSAFYTIGFGLSNILMNDLLTKRYPWVTHTRQRLIFGIIGTLVLNLVMTVLLSYIDVVVFQKRSFDFFSNETIINVWLILNIALLISALFHAYGFMTALKKSHQEKLEAEQRLSQIKEAQFESLKSQLDPHFLFNSLNVLSALIEENPKKAQIFTDELSKIYRYVLEHKDKPLVTLTEELSFAKVYTHLLSTRFDKSVQFHFEIEPSDREFIVPLSLQLLLENIIKHNTVTEQSPLKIRLYKENNNLVVENNLQKRTLSQHRKGIGLQNIKQRYALQTSNPVAIEESVSHFKVSLPILSSSN